MKLIIDSGSTKTEWAILKGNKVVDNFISKGFNPYYTNPEEIGRYIEKAWPVSFDPAKIKHIYFYGTGCSTRENCNLVQSIFQRFFPDAVIAVYHDLQGAALALLKNEKGIACILGTGSNSCLWDGNKVVENVPSLGYLLGDEGSAVYLGKLLLKIVLSGKADKEITQAFYDFAGMNFAEILHKIYKDAYSNRWIGSLAPFVTKNINHPQIQEIARKNFQDFIENQISAYTGYLDLEISFQGSVAYHLQDILKEVMEESGLKTGLIVKGPMEGLIDYYREFEV
jgi:N-acetylglucosamine kinase-like BadF-type ATPase